MFITKKGTLNSVTKKTDKFEYFHRSPLDPLKGTHLTLSGLIPLGNKRACAGKEKKPVFLEPLFSSALDYAGMKGYVKIEFT